MMQSQQRPLAVLFGALEQVWVFRDALSCPREVQVL